MSDTQDRLRLLRAAGYVFRPTDGTDGPSGRIAVGKRLTFGDLAVTRSLVRWIDYTHAPGCWFGGHAAQAARIAEAHAMKRMADAAEWDDLAEAIGGADK